MWSKSFDFSHVSLLKYNLMLKHATSALGGNISTLIVWPHYVFPVRRQVFESFKHVGTFLGSMPFPSLWEEMKVKLWCSCAILCQTVTMISTDIR